MRISIDNKHQIGDTVKYFESEFKNKVHGSPEVITHEKESEVDEIIIRVTRSEITWSYKLKDHTVRTDNTLLEKH